MGGMLVRRLVLLVPMLLGITFVAFMLGELSPSDPAEVAIRVNAMVPTPELIAQTRHELGLDRPLMTRYLEWLAGVLQGDLGTSFVTGHKVTDDFLRAFPPTLALAGTHLSSCSLRARDLARSAPSMRTPPPTARSAPCSSPSRRSQISGRRFC